MNQKLLISILIMVSLLILPGCSSNDLAVLAQQREKNAGQKDNIIIGVPVPLNFAQENTKFLKGIDMALEEINSEGVNGKKVQLKIADDEGVFKTAVDIAQEFSEDTRMIAVIGHWYSDICIPISNIYEQAGMLTIVPTVSNPVLTEKGYKYIFQSIVNDKKIAKEMCTYANNQGYKNIVICYEESSYGKNLADAIEKEARENKIKIVDRTSGLLTEEQFKKAHDKWKALEFDAMLLALNMPEGEDYIKALRVMNKEAAILSADGLDVENFIETLGQDAEGVVLITTYSPWNEQALLKQFAKNYREKYNEEPDVWAIQGYESLQVITHAIRETKSYSPAVLADYLRNMEPWPSISGEIGFNEYGEIEGRGIYKKIVADGQFEYID